MADVNFEMIPQTTWKAAEEVAETYADQVANEPVSAGYDDVVFEAAQRAFSNDDPDRFAASERELYFAAAQILAERHGIVVNA